MTPSTDLPRLDPPQRLLAGPGPSNVEPAVLEAMQKPMLGHLDPDLHEILLELVDFQRRVYNAKGGLVFPHQATGSSGMECGLVNLLEPGDIAIVAVTGFFGNRIARMAERTGAKVVEVRADYGQIAPNEALLDAIDGNPGARLVAVVHAETSTGVRHPVEDLGRELKRRGGDTLLFVDCVTSLGAHPVEFDEWGFDFAYSCTQKALAAPPRMSPLAISDRALERVAVRKAPVPFTFDLDLLRKFWIDRPVTYHHTAPILHIYALHDREEAGAGMALELVQEALVRDDLAVVGLHLDDVRAGALGHLRDAVPEEAGVRDDRGVARLEQVLQAALHAGGARGLVREHQPALRLVDLALEVDDLVEDVVQVGIQVAQHRLLHRGEHARLHVAGAGPGKQALRGIERGEVGWRRHPTQRTRYLPRESTESGADPLVLSMY